MYKPSFSMIEDFPAPGEPHMPILMADILRASVRLKTSLIMLSASNLSDSLVDSIRVIVLLIATLLLASS